MSKKIKKLAIYPKFLKEREGVFTKNGSQKIYIPKSVGFSFGYYLERLGFGELPVVFSESEEKYIVIAAENKQTDYPRFESRDAYRIEAEESALKISANTDIGLSYALRALIRLSAQNGTIPCVSIEDEPDVGTRCVHMCVFDPQDGSEKDDTSYEAVKARIELAAVLGYNYVFIEFWGMFPFERHPYASHPYTEYTKEKIRALVAHCKNDLHIIPCPGQNLTSHAGWSRITTRRHVSLDQRPDLRDMWIPGGWCFATENPRTKEFLRDVVDELYEAFDSPPFMHMGCDKAFGFGSTEEDRTKSADMLFAMHISNLNSYISHKGARPVMWADMLYTSMDSLTFKCAPCVTDMLPKNILMNIWTHNDPGEYWHDIDYFEDKGFETVYSPFVNYDSIKNMIKLCVSHGSRGIVQTTWHRPEYALPYITYSISKQWNSTADISEECIGDLISKIYKK